VVEMIAAAERLEELLDDPEITSTDVRVIPRATPKVGIGVVEAPRGTLIHHYETDERGLIRKVNLIVATQGNSARMAMSVERAAKALIRGGEVSDGLLNKVEMAFRAYDPCHGCAAHTLPGQMGLVARLIAPDGTVMRTIER
jgi:F420-non-reducing hydrogenase large subunit